jgi:tRNA(Ile)-lysidine synthase
MRRSFEVYRRPLLDIDRQTTETACLVEGIEFWSDPHNSDDRYTRVRVRTTVLPMLEDELGPGVAAALARTADMLRVDTAYLDGVSAAALETARADEGLSMEVLHRLPDAIRTRVLRLAALEAGAPSTELFHTHVLETDRLLTDWHGQKWVDLPGHVRVARRDARLSFTPGPGARPSP